MRPDDHIAATPARAALVVANANGATTLDYRRLSQRSRQLAAYWAREGLREGDTVAVLLENRVEAAEIMWAAQRSGLRYTFINHHLLPADVAYIVQDSDAVCVVTSADLAESLLPEFPALIRVALCMDRDVSGYARYETIVDAAERIFADAPAVEGAMMLYSSGTTGRPKGVKYDRPRQRYGEFVAIAELLRDGFGIGPDSVLLLAGPLYHAAPLSWMGAAQRLGATVIALDKYDAHTCLQLISQHGVTHALMVPTHFVRLLKLDSEVRARYSTASLQRVIHAGAPCPVEVKRRMMAWWGPILHEFYSSTEANGFVMIGPHEWLAHPGSVGKVTRGSIRITDDAGQPMPPGEPGLIWFESAGVAFSYHKAEDKTRAAYDAQGRSTVGDIGYVDADGYLYLTDRKANMIVSGGVNIYPQEIESLLTLHPDVHDLAVIGTPDEDLGEIVTAVVVPTPGVAPDERLAAALSSYCRAHLASFKCPRKVRFVEAVPRTPTGKLLKRLIALD
ncbi:AMP-binding protein [Pandoraea apista]|uniref:AMP-binding protein n=1 Tax=Pandoraea apista TaxID=93218 RepID=UPI000659FC13|nr:AMP-binding protein [Pandoraea apista]ALS65172.1 hypothetical protein AT395_09370 [Pandoraea apista]RRW92409.1 acyl-CoA synthetase [Pandoraea apista]RRX01873.1 acyl-CoA synthetase [Pandoraea apista]CFB65590.1 Long-chain-fatty-acid--CoA ligase [Pandoraea apista]